MKMIYKNEKINNNVNDVNVNVKVLKNDKEFFNAIKTFTESLDNYCIKNDLREKYYSFLSVLKQYLEITDAAVSKKISKNILDNTVNKMELFLENNFMNLVKDILNEFGNKSNEKSIKISLLRLSHLASVYQSILSSKYGIGNRIQVKNIFKEYRSMINKNVFKGCSVNSLSDLEKILNSSEKKYIPFLLSVYMNTFINYKKSVNTAISPAKVIEKKEGDCIEYALLAKYILNKYNYEAHAIGIYFKNENIGHSLCVYLDDSGKWDVIDVTGYWNTNEKFSNEAILKIYKNISSLTKINVIFSNDGGFSNWIYETKIYP